MKVHPRGWAGNPAERAPTSVAEPSMAVLLETHGLSVGRYEGRSRMLSISRRLIGDRSIFERLASVTPMLT